MHKFNNCQLIMIAELREDIIRLKEQGKEYKDIRFAIVEKYKDSHWLVTNQREREESIGAALISYAMTEEQQEAVSELKKLTGQILF